MMLWWLVAALQVSPRRMKRLVTAPPLACMNVCQWWGAFPVPLRSKGAASTSAPTGSSPRMTKCASSSTELLGDELVRVRRQTRILNAGTFFDYPLTPFNAMFGIGVRQGLSIAGSYAVARMRALNAHDSIETFEDWIVDRFGRRLYEAFFKSYTEKVWGIPCNQISADWADSTHKGAQPRCGDSERL